MEDHGKVWGVALGLQEAPQTTVWQDRRSELPFLIPRPRVLRGRGCNRSFHARGIPAYVYRIVVNQGKAYVCIALK
ncbi:hypothetical protein AAFF_G00281330 [Aldrovandia affinis]|uniref:Uncharacterized protein n=1 Tax=Aldrovandia affinis TaxID=143900 RepID=A0AAD7W138_9TELE|nr:hypothetical protein AAFF_G00281330 [Aldrovandia affinis]